MDFKTRRGFLSGLSTCGVALWLGGCGRKAKEHEVTAVEDLMREHGILRRALLVYEEAAREMHTPPSSSIIEALQKTARLFRSFGEDYHEKLLEEMYIFPFIIKSVPPLTPIVNTLKTQHDRGREITDYILMATKNSELKREKVAELALVLDGFVLMYRHHAAIEDTEIFPAWKQSLPAGRLDDLGEKFEDIEHEQFGDDGFEKALDQIRKTEKILGFRDLNRYTAPPAPNS